LTDLFRAIDDLNIDMNEVWYGIDYLARAAKENELGLIAPGIGLEHFLDLRLDEIERRAGISGGTARTIEGPLYVAGAPLSKAEARLDDGLDAGEVLFVEGGVTGVDGKPIPGAVVDVWHANSFGNYSIFDSSQSKYNLRRRIECDAQGRYRFRSIMPSGYGCPPGSHSESLMKALGRHGQRPAHIHFMVTAPGHRQLTTQINIAGDKYLHDDFAFGTRDELIASVIRNERPEEIEKRGLQKPFAEIKFDFKLTSATDKVVDASVHRDRVEAA
jgi:catechol 1,2-dioxygenase